MIAGSLCLLAANAGLSIAAWRFSRSLATGRTAADLLLFLLVRLLLISAVVIGFGHAGLLRPLPLGLGGLVALAFLLRPGVFAGFPVQGPPLSRPWKVLVLLVALRLLLQVWIFSPYVNDTLAYHLPKVAAWTQAGALTTDLGPDLRGWFPSGFELVETWWTLFLHHDVLIEVAGLEFLLLGVLAAAALAEGLGLGPAGAAKAGILYGLVPGIQIGATSCLNDAPAAAVIVALFALARLRASWMLVLGTLAFGVGIKATVLFAAPGVALLSFLERRGPRVGSPPRRTAVPYLIVALLVGGYWYARNAWLHSNPVYPMGAAGFLDDRGMQVQQVLPNPAGLLQNLRSFARSRLNDPYPPGPMLQYIAGWGALAVAAGLPGLLKACQARPEFRRLAASFGLSLGCVLLMVIPDRWNLRFILFFPALLMPAALLLADAWPPVRRLLAAALLIQILGTMIPEEFGVGSIGERMAMPWRTRWSTLIVHDPWSTEVIAAGPNARRTYLLYRPDYGRRVETILAEDPETLVRRMKAAGAGTLHAGVAHPVLRACLQRKLLKQEPGNFFSLPP